MSDSESDGERQDRVRESKRSNKGKPPRRLGFEESGEGQGVAIKTEAPATTKSPVSVPNPQDNKTPSRMELMDENSFDRILMKSIGKKEAVVSREGEGGQSTSKSPQSIKQEDDHRSTKSKSSHKSNRSLTSMASSTRRRKVEAELDLEKTIAEAEAAAEERKIQRQIEEFERREALESERRETFRKLEEQAEEKKLARLKSLAAKKLELKLAKIDEEAGSGSTSYYDDDEGSQELSDDGSRGRPPSKRESTTSSVSRWLGNLENRLGNLENHPPKSPSKKSPLMASTPKVPVDTQEGSPMEQVVRDLAKTFSEAFKLATPTKQENPGKTADTNMNRFLVRQTMGKDLPNFSGDPEEWPGFYEEFNRSTQMCGFSQGENLNRLRKCLKGKAKDSVQAMLIAPENVDEVVKTLQLNFGKPAYIIKTVIEKAKKTPAPKDGKLESIIPYSNAVRNLVTTMESLKRPEYLGNPVLIEELSQKLPDLYLVSWAKEKRDVEKKNGLVTLKDFSDWLVEQAEIMTEIWTPKASDFEKEKGQKESKGKSFKENKSARAEKVFSAEESSSKAEEPKNEAKSGQRKEKSSGQEDSQKPKKECPFCRKASHALHKCWAFAKETPEGRNKFIRENRHCFCCLRRGHSAKDCKDKEECGVNGCIKHHHKLFHLEKEEKKEDVVGHATISHCNQVLLRIVPVVLIGPKGKVSTFAFLDDGSTCSMIEAEIAEKIGVHGPVKPLIVKGIHGVESRDEKSERVQFQVKGSNQEEPFTLKNVKKVQQLGIPGQTVNVKSLAKRWDYLNKVELQSLKNARPTVLIGEDNIDLIIAREVIEGPPNAPCLSRTKLGWVIHGNVAAFRGRVDEDFTFHCYESHREEEMSQLMRDSFSTESFGVRLVKRPLESKDDERARTLMEASTRKTEDGHYETGLLWKTDDTNLPPSKDMALKRLYTAEKKMDRDPVFAKWYQDKIDEYSKKGYIRLVSPQEAVVHSPKTWYLPHFGVTHPNKPGKIRFVFDAAAKSRGSSLNDNLLQGPDILNSLVGTLFKFRQRKYAFGGDMTDFFHQVRVKKEDQDAQRFLWRGMDRDREPDTMAINVLFFGATCSPYAANYVKNLNAHKAMEKYHDAAIAILTRHYVDDYLDSTDTEEEGIDRIQSVIAVHKEGGFEIGKWSSSSKAILAKIPPELRNTELKNVSESSEMPNERTLGLVWDPNSDTFQFNMKFPKVHPDIVQGSTRPTKRQVLKLVMSMFDPLGFLAHYVVKAKILMQEIWKTGIGWDDELPQELFEKFKNWIEELPKVADVRIRRCYTINTTAGKCNAQLHVFCDASSKAFTAVAYCRFEKDEEVETSLIMAKTRVAPVRILTIPRLELQAAVMASRLATLIREEHEIKFDETIFWSDSATVIRWVRLETRTYKTFVAHRMSEILEDTEVGSWRWIPTDLNVADDATRDDYPTNLGPDSRWWHGPEFLLLSRDQWPKEDFQKIREVKVEDLEFKKEVAMAAIESKDILSGMSRFLPDIVRFGLWLHLIRSTARIILFARLWPKLVISRKTGGRIDHPRNLTQEDVESAELLWVKYVQLESFPDEVHDLSIGISISRKSKLFKLSPYLDHQGILRIKGRIGAAPGISDDVKFPIILSPAHTYTRLLIDYHHVRASHRGMERVLNEIRQKYHILGMRQAVKSSWTRCQDCKIRRAVPIIPEMGALPASRITPYVRPFTHTGMDYFGPMDVTVGRRHDKRYGVLFTCLTTRAVHLEVAESLTTDSCIMAIRRFIARRGSPKKMNSDNGTNLKGADRELREAIQDFDIPKIRDSLAPQGIDWHFIPPSAPHMGGAWERMVQSTKRVLKATLKERAPREKVLETLMTEAEAMVNSCPLTHVSSDPNDPESLTPYHFLIGTSSGVQAPGKFTEEDFCVRRQWKVSQRLADHFWKRWIKEYLPTLTTRRKWHEKVEPVKVGDLVFIADGDEPRGSWPRGIVVRTYPGKDGQVRTVDVKTSTGVYKRPVAKLVVLDVPNKLGEGDPSPGGNMSSRK